MRFIIALVIIMAASACGNDTTPQVIIQKQQPSDPAFDAVKPLIDANCSKCHNGNIEPAFPDAATFKASDAKARIAAGTMPPGGGLSADAKAKLLAYLNQ